LLLARLGSPPSEWDNQPYEYGLNFLLILLLFSKQFYDMVMVQISQAIPLTKTIALRSNDAEPSEGRFF
jgi:hypothetical protein